MPWWSWPVIWVVLVLGMFAMLAWFGWTLFQKLMGVASALQDMAAALEPLSQVASAQLPAWRSSLFMDPAAVAARRDTEKSKRDERREARHQHRITRGKLLVRADYREFTHLTKKRT